MDVFSVIEAAWGFLPVDDLFNWLADTPEGRAVGATVVSILVFARGAQTFVMALQKWALKTKTKKDDAILAWILRWIDALIEVTATAASGDWKGVFYRVRAIVHGSAVAVVAVTAEPRPTPRRRKGK
ncbi:hypothetical protein LCGC14_1319220 [marine sediment metagenome]|uniref:Uncharacterized protein n=1 Tax=marine sediment metagenome TaxID=412755 RepID=A0A0F9KKI4_9ZZZZ